MGIPCSRGPARLAAVALFALQISMIMVPSSGSAMVRTSTRHDTVGAAEPAGLVVTRTYRIPMAMPPVLRTYTLDATAKTRATGAVGRARAARPAAVGSTADATRAVRGERSRATATRAAPRAVRQVALDRRVLQRSASSLRLAHSHATRLLSRAGLRLSSTGGCADRNTHSCTSLDAVRAQTVRKVIGLKRRSGCPIVITGGTESGHTPGVFSHGNGYKVDVALGGCIDGYITRRFRQQGTRADGARVYVSRRGDVYAHEGDHWDILFR
jgi:hypothetical protein